MVNPRARKKERERRRERENEEKEGKRRFKIVKKDKTNFNGSFPIHSVRGKTRDDVLAIHLVGV